MVQLLNRQSSHFFDPYLPEFSSPQSVEILWPYCRNHIEDATPLWSIQSWKCHPIQWHIPITLLRGITPPGGRVSCQIAVIIFALFTFHIRYCAWEGGPVSSTSRGSFSSVCYSSGFSLILERNVAVRTSRFVLHGMTRRSDLTEASGTGHDLYSFEKSS